MLGLALHDCIINNRRSNHSVVCNSWLGVAHGQTSSGVSECDTQTGFISQITDSQLTSSSSWSGLGVGNSRLSSGYSWSAGGNSAGQYIQADFGALRRIERIGTKGRGNYPQWVTSYTFAYSVDGSTYEYILNDDNSHRVFQANANQNTEVVNDLDDVYVARYVRLVVQTWYSHISLRWEVYGCDLGTT